MATRRKAPKRALAAGVPGVARERAPRELPGVTHNALASPQGRWARTVRYAWDRKRG